MTRKASSKRFTLIEILTVIAIMIVLAGIGVSGYRRLSSDLAYGMAASRVRNLVVGTVAEAKRNRVPTQIRLTSGTVKKNGSNGFSIYGNFSIKGGKSSLVAYWNFNTLDLSDGTPHQDGRKGINRINLASTPNIGEGYVGEGAAFDGNDSITTEASYKISAYSNLYVEAMVKADVGHLIDNSADATLFDASGGTGFSVKLVPKSGGKEIAHFSINGSNFASSVAYPEDDQWHKIGVSKVEGVGFSVYLDDVLIGRGGNGGNSDNLNSTQTFTFGNGLVGNMDEIKIYNLSGGESVELSGDNAYFYFGTKYSNRTITLNISPLGTIDDVSGEEVANFRYAFPISINHPKWTCVVDWKSYKLDNATTGESDVMNKVRNMTGKGYPIVSKHSSFPKTGYAWIATAKNQSINELVKYMWYPYPFGSSDSQNKQKIGYVKLLKSNLFGTDGIGKLNQGQSILIYTEPVVITRDGAVL